MLFFWPVCLLVSTMITSVSGVLIRKHRWCLCAALWHAATRTYTCAMCPGGTYGALIGNNTSEARALAVVRCGLGFPSPEDCRGLLVPPVVRVLGYRFLPLGPFDTSYCQ